VWTIAISITIVFGLVGWTFDLRWVREIFGVMGMIVGAAILASAIPASVALHRGRKDRDQGKRGQGTDGAENCG
jgi:hypothetical protein